MFIFTEKKLTTTRVRKYHQEYCKRTKSRMCNKNYKEEVMFKKLFEKGTFKNIVFVRLQ